MYEDLWAGPELKFSFAGFHVGKMERAVEPRERGPYDVGVGGAVVDLRPQFWVFAHLDAFLSAARSIPEVIQCCFGDDRHSTLSAWRQALSPDEQTRRRAFRNRFATAYDAFRALPLSNARHTIEHRRGYPDVEITVIGRFGATYIGSPTVPIEAAELPPMNNPQLPLMVTPLPVQPRHGDFTIDGQPLFGACRTYLEHARGLINDARALAEQVHAGQPVTPPPDATRQDCNSPA